MDPRVPVAPLLVVPATSLACQSGTRELDGEPAGCVMIQLANAAVTCQMPIDLDQARQFRDDIERAIIEAQHQVQGIEVATRMPANGKR